MPGEKTVSQNDQVRQVVHDLFGYLHSIGINISVLKSVRDDELRFNQICDSIDAQRQKAHETANQLRALLGQLTG